MESVYSGHPAPGGPAEGGQPHPYRGLGERQEPNPPAPHPRGAGQRPRPCALVLPNGLGQQRRRKSEHRSWGTQGHEGPDRTRPGPLILLALDTRDDSASLIAPRPPNSKGSVLCTWAGPRLDGLPRAEDDLGQGQRRARAVRQLRPLGSAASQAQTRWPFRQGLQTRGTAQGQGAAAAS